MICVFDGLRHASWSAGLYKHENDFSQVRTYETYI